MDINHGKLRIREIDSWETALQKMRNGSASYAVVFSKNDVPVGTVCISDFVNALSEEQEMLKKHMVAEVMDRNFTVLNENTKLEDLLEENIEHLTFPMVVIDCEGNFQGMITELELLHILYKNLQYTKCVLDNIDEGIIAIDSSNHIAYTNESWKQIHGIKGNQLIGENVADKFPETKLGTDQMQEFDSKPLHLNFSGATVIPSYHSMVNDENQSVGAVAIVKDYSKLNNIYIGISRISKTNALFNSMFNYLSEAVVYVGKQFEIIYCNKSFSNIFEVISGNILPDSEIKKIIKEKYKSVKIDIFNKEIEVVRKEGEHRNFNIVGIPTVDVNNTLTGVVVILHDTTHLKKLDYELQRRGRLLDYYKKEANKIPDNMICESENFREILSTALKVAPTSAAVLIEGENGVGKELVAKLIHHNSDRCMKDFIAVNCGAIPESLWESEMFGYEDGAFTGAKKGGKRGIFEMADGGTVFLDEIGEMPISMQVKMLRFLQDMEIAKVGRKEVKKVDVRIIAATNKELEKMVKEGQFRIDLYYRLNVVKLKIPPLRDRVAEIRPLAEKFVSSFNDRYHKSVTISTEAITLLEREFWPGNIRQLQNVIEQSVIMCDEIIQPYDLPIDANIADRGEKEMNGGHGQKGNELNIPYRTELLEKDLMRNALKRCNGNRSKAMKLLGISRKTFYKKMKDYNLYD